MIKFKVQKVNNYSVISNHLLRDKKLSYKAKGLLAYLLSLPEDWEVSLNGLVQVSKEGIKAIRNIIQELEQNNYLKRTQTRNKLGHIDYEYTVYEEPYSPKGYAVKGNAVKDIQISTNNKDKIDKQNILEVICPITKELVNNKFLDINGLTLYYYDNLFKKLLSKYEYKDIITAVNYTVNKIKENNYIDENNNKIINLFGYFKSSLVSNLNKITSDIELYEGDE